MKIEAQIIEVRGAGEAEVYAKAALALGRVMAGSGVMTQSVERTLEPAGHDRVTQLVGLLRDLVTLFYDERLIVCAIDVGLGPPFSATAKLAHWDPELHHDGVEVESVSYGGARFEPDGDGWRAVAVLDG
jgi:SHS2 domain-containing protein